MCNVGVTDHSECHERSDGSRRDCLQDGSSAVPRLLNLALLYGIFALLAGPFVIKGPIPSPRLFS